MVLRKEFFDLPEGIIYLDGNSLGPLPKTAKDRVADMMQDEWGAQLIKGWNSAGWMAQPSRVGNAVGRLIGAPPGTTVMGDTLSIKVYQALAAALKMRPDRKVILSDSGNFPTDLYMAQGLIQMLGNGYDLRVVAPEAVADAIDDSVAAVMLTQVDYRTGRMHDMKTLTELAHSAGAVMIWDLAHSAGAVPVDVAGCGCEFAVGCTYKYLNGGPGAPAFIYVRQDLADHVEPALAGWLGHDAPFAFDLDYRPAPGIERMRVGTPPVIQLTALEAALEVWETVDMSDIRAASVALQDTFIREVEARVPDLTLASPRNSAERGSQVSFRFAHGYAAMQALIARGVIGDFRAPDIMRFGFTPLYLDERDVLAAVDHIETVMGDRLWDDPAFMTRQRVT
ncbi:kynureninase [Tateyamaria omphalii]|uniref:Kynureninase n=1 Tax=Tateyamaria omphalii TaxID=299262 RepID=A0A1P8MRK1_9RHOB|nr:kynureninase [Tateyamaria omphalii]APX10675.1 kynureninase [Tateyamaria omphalii]